MEKSNTTIDGVRFAYIRDPLCRLRVVTIAYTVDDAQDGDRKSVTYACTINRVETFKHAPSRIKDPKRTDIHCKATARDIALDRLTSTGLGHVGHCYTDKPQNAVNAITDEYIAQCAKIEELPRRKRNFGPTMYREKVYRVLERAKDQRNFDKTLEVVREQLVHHPEQAPFFDKIDACQPSE